MRGIPFTQAQRRLLQHSCPRPTLLVGIILLAAVLSACNGNTSGEDEEEDNKYEQTTNLIDNTTDTPKTDWSAQTPQASDITDLILVTGQSNVRGSHSDYDSALDTPSKQAFAFNSDGQWRVSDLHNAWDGNWAPGNGSLHDKSRQPHNNFVFHFGKIVAERDSSRVIGYVVISAPGKGIAYWDRDKEFFFKVQEAAINGINAQGLKTEFDAVLWHQGETDWQAWGTSDPAIVGEERNYQHYYRDKLNLLIADLRAQPWINDNAYFICGETAIAPVNEVLMNLNNDNDPRTGCVRGEGLPTLAIDPVAVHFDGVGLRELGKRYAEMYLKMTE